MAVRHKILSVIALFGSSGTLLCCALPALVATIAGGAAVGGMLSAMPWLISLSHYKTLIFAFAFFMTALNGFLIYRNKGEVVCDLSGGEGCEVAGRFSRVMFWVSLGTLLVGAFFAYALVPLLRFFE